MEKWFEVVDKVQDLATDIQREIAAIWLVICLDEQITATVFFEILIGKVYLCVEVTKETVGGTFEMFSAGSKSWPREEVKAQPKDAFEEWWRLDGGTEVLTGHVGGSVPV